MKASFIVPAHNEDKNIALCLAHLLYLEPYIDYEVLIGLDNCTDFTENIVRQMCKGHRQCRYYIFNERQGKAKLINQLIKKAKGEIIIMNDADWIFDFNSHDWNYMINILKNKNIYGIADALPVTWPIKKDAGILETGTTLYGMVWEDAVKNRAIDYVPGYKILDEKYFPLLVNIFKKEGYIPNNTLADDFERCFNLFKHHKKVLVHTGLEPMRLKSLGEQYSLAGIFKQKKRTAIAREQLKKIYGSNSMKIPKWDLIKSIWRNVVQPCKIKYIWSFGIVSILFILGGIFKPKDLNTQQGWSLRGR